MGPLKLLKKIAVFLLFFQSPYVIANVKDLGCALLKGEVALSSVEPLWSKPNSINSVNNTKQSRFVETLEPIAKIDRVVEKNQCHHSCQNFSYATFLDYLAPPDFGGTISGGWITAKSFELKFLDAIENVENTVSPDTILRNTRETIQIYGILTDEQYPSNSNVNTLLLSTILNDIAQTFHNETRREVSAKKVDNYRSKALILAKEVVQHFFGEYPELILRNGIPTSAAEQNVLITRSLSPFPVQIKNITKFHNLTKSVVFLLENKIPILLSFRVSRQHNGSGVYLKENEPISKPHSNHILVITGVYKNKVGAYYARANNTHENAKTLYFSWDYLAKVFNYATFFIPHELQSQYANKVE